VSLLLRRENVVDPFEVHPRDFELVDDVGTTYSRCGGSGTRELRILYRTPAPAGAGWLELRRAGSRSIRISL
jgi:hypothetical protein